MSFTLKKQPSEAMREIAERFQKLRRKEGFTQAECAERSGVSLGSLKRFERTGKISLESLLLLARLIDRVEDFDGVFKPSEDRSAIEGLFSDFLE